MMFQFRPVGPAAHSQGRKPLERRDVATEPRRADSNCVSRSLSPLRGWLFDINHPGAYAPGYALSPLRG